MTKIYREKVFDKSRKYVRKNVIKKKVSDKSRKNISKEGVTSLERL